MECSLHPLAFARVRRKLTDVGGTHRPRKVAGLLRDERAMPGWSLLVFGRSVMKSFAEVLLSLWPDAQALDPQRFSEQAAQRWLDASSSAPMGRACSNGLVCFVGAALVLLSPLCSLPPRFKQTPEYTTRACAQAARESWAAGPLSAVCVSGTKGRVHSHHLFPALIASKVHMLCAWQRFSGARAHALPFTRSP